MPLSLHGHNEMNGIGRTLGLDVSFVPDREIHSPVADAIVERFRLALVDAGIPLHYPSLSVVRNSKRTGVGRAIFGYKKRDAYLRLLRSRIDEGRTPGKGGTDPNLELALGVRIVWRLRVQPSPGAFFRWLPGRSLLAFDQGMAVRLHDFVADTTVRGPGTHDLVPSPEGTVLVTPTAQGLAFFDTHLSVRYAMSGRAPEDGLVFVDTAMTDEYPSVGILSAASSGDNQVVVRVMTSWATTVVFRDYQVTKGPDDTRLTVRPISEPTRPCPQLHLSIPMLSKAGDSVAARDEQTGTTKIFRIGELGVECSEVLDLGIATSKVAFAASGRLIAYSAVHENGGEPGLPTLSSTYVHSLDSDTAMRLPGSESQGLSIPEFVGEDTVLVAVRDAAQSSTAEFRMLCCVGTVAQGIH